jgi:hypothetical protein
MSTGTRNILESVTTISLSCVRISFSVKCDLVLHIEAEASFGIIRFLGFVHRPVF